MKKSSQSRRLMKQKKAEKKQQRGKFGQNEFDQNSNGGDNDNDSGSDLTRVIPLPDLEIKVRDTIPRKEAPTRCVTYLFYAEKQTYFSSVKKY